MYCMWCEHERGEGRCYVSMSDPSTQGFYRLGAALVGLERYTDALVAFAQGLSSDSKQVALLDAIVETMLKSSFKGKASTNYCALDRDVYDLVALHSSSPSHHPHPHH